MEIVLTALAMRLFIVPDRAAAIPNLPLFNIFIATLNPPPIPVKRFNQKSRPEIERLKS